MRYRSRRRGRPMRRRSFRKSIRRRGSRPLRIGYRF